MRALGRVGTVEAIEPLFELADLASVKQSGGLNNDWDLTHRVLSLLSTRVIGMTSVAGLDGWPLYERTVKNCDVGPLADYLSSSNRPLHELMQIDSQPQSDRASILRGLTGSLWRGLRRLLGTALFLVVVYVGLRLFGDEAVLSMLDALEARLLVGWERALQYLQGLRAAGFGAVVAGGLSTCGDCR